ncbi:g8632 [Coccomyxa elongata]
MVIALFFLALLYTYVASTCGEKLGRDRFTVKKSTLRGRSGSKYGAQCGKGWQEQYTLLHATILQSKPAKQRLAIVELHKNGLGDRLTSAITIFYFALLSGRAFRIDWKGASNDVALTSALEKPNVDWEFKAGDLEGQEGTQRVNWFQKDGYWPQHTEPFDAFGGNDLALMWREARAVVFAINTGVVDTLFYNPYHRQQLFEWGLMPETAVGCALDFLFRPRAEVLDLVRDVHAQLRDSGALKLGIQIRLGDDYLKDKPRGTCDEAVDDEHVERWFRCAAKVEEEYRVEGRPVYWYIVSDCPSLRTEAAKLYGAKVLLPSHEMVTEHIEHASGNATRDRLAFRTTVAEQWLFGMTDFQVITERSSFGRLAALRSLRFRSVFTVRSAEALAERGRNISTWECSRANFDGFEDVAVRHNWVKI